MNNKSIVLFTILVLFIIGFISNVDGQKVEVKKITVRPALNKLWQRYKDRKEIEENGKEGEGEEETDVLDDLLEKTQNTADNSHTYHEKLKNGEEEYNDIMGEKGQSLTHKVAKVRFGHLYGQEENPFEVDEKEQLKQREEELFGSDTDAPVNDTETPEEVNPFDEEEKEDLEEEKITRIDEEEKEKEEEEEAGDEEEENSGSNQSCEQENVCEQKEEEQKEEEQKDACKQQDACEAEKKEEEAQKEEVAAKKEEDAAKKEEVAAKKEEEAVESHSDNTCQQQQDTCKQEAEKKCEQQQDTCKQEEHDKCQQAANTCQDSQPEEEPKDEEEESVEDQVKDAEPSVDEEPSFLQVNPDEYVAPTKFLQIGEKCKRDVECKSGRCNGLVCISTGIEKTLRRRAQDLQGEIDYQKKQVLIEREKRYLAVLMHTKSQHDARRSTLEEQISDLQDALDKEMKKNTEAHEKLKAQLGKEHAKAQLEEKEEEQKEEESKTDKPTDEPTVQPTQAPTQEPTDAPTQVATVVHATHQEKVAALPKGDAKKSIDDQQDAMMQKMLG